MASVAHDDFNRADASSLGTSSSGHTWAVTSGTWTIADDEGHPPLSLSAYAAATLDDGATAEEVIVEVTITSSPGRDFDGGPILHFVDINNFVFMNLSRTGDNYLFRGYQRVGGSFSALTALVNPVSGMAQGTPFVARIEMAGDSGEFFVDGVSLGTFSGVDASLLTATAHGVIFSASDGAIPLDFDDFDIDDGSTGGATVQGTASAALGLTATAAGAPRTLGTASAELALGATAAGAPRTPGTAAAQLSVAGSAAGEVTHPGAAVTSITVGATASGTPTVLGAAGATLALTATALGSGQPIVTGSASAALALTATAEGIGTPVTTGAAVTSITLGATVSGLRRPPGQLSAPIVLGATATGLRSTSGAASSALVLAATVSGRPFTPVAGIAGLLEGPGTRSLVGAAAGPSTSGLPGRVVGD